MKFCLYIDLIGVFNSVKAIFPDVCIVFEEIFRSGIWGNIVFQDI
jgi:hypothetical protein